MSGKLSGTCGDIWKPAVKFQQTEDALNVLTPNILKVAPSGNQRSLLSSLLGTETNQDLQRSASILILPIQGELQVALLFK
ncbi:hypothetical protein DPEC_G00203570 [Dallia pectoralis]|uniref:Uncharacterized protein n=1 Tax=Dallia pectoralis TaxID=75939 RepID=A0ACC2G9I7_DALPE|nr:hypothetical protein DPEC_G00203570 [Dallia pectoralis]